MKKLVAIVMLIILAAGFAACGQKNVEGSLDELMDKVYADSGVEENFYSGLMEQEVSEEREVWFFGTDKLDYQEARASEPMMGGAYSLVLVRMNQGADIEEAKTLIKENVDPYKWICMGVDPDDIYVENVGDLILLLMCSNRETSQKIVEAFLALGK